MDKVKIIVRENCTSLEEEINNFLLSKEVSRVTTISFTAGNTLYGNVSALILYETWK